MYPNWQQGYMSYNPTFQSAPNSAFQTTPIGNFQTTPIGSFQEAIPKPPLRVKLTPRERGSFNIFLTQADPDGHNRVEGPQAVEFFKRSGLPTDVLKSIWNISTPDGENFLDRERFYVALRLIALAQEGKQVSEQAIYDDVQAGIPKFQSNVVVKDKWEVEPSDKEKYLRVFNQLGGMKGFLDTNEAISAFRETGVKSEYLKKIWNLSDPGDTGEFKESQFIVAMHLVNRVKNMSEPVPDELPPPLKKIISAKPAEIAKPQVLEAPVDSLQEAFSIQQLTKPGALGQNQNLNLLTSQFQTAPSFKINLENQGSMNAMKVKVEEKKDVKKEEDDLLMDEPVMKIDESPKEKIVERKSLDRKSIEIKSVEKVKIEEREIGQRNEDELSEQIERMEEKIQKKFREWRDVRAKLSLEREKGQVLQSKLHDANSKYLKELSQSILSILGE